MEIPRFAGDSSWKVWARDRLRGGVGPDIYHVFCLNSFSVKAGSVTDNGCSLSGHSLVFGAAGAEFVSRIGVTPPLDLSPCAEEREPASELLW